MGARRELCEPWAAPDAAALRDALDRVLASTTFQRTHRLSALLRDLAEHTLLGDGAALKEFAIGQRVFGRSAGYNSGDDNIVRANARQLRLKLEDYYRSEGVHDPARIQVPKGGYAITLEWRSATAGPLAEGSRSAKEQERAAQASSMGAGAAGTHPAPLASADSPATEAYWSSALPLRPAGSHDWVASASSALEINQGGPRMRESQGAEGASPTLGVGTEPMSRGLSGPDAPGSPASVRKGASGIPSETDGAARTNASTHVETTDRAERAEEARGAFIASSIPGAIPSAGPGARPAARPTATTAGVESETGVLRGAPSSASLPVSARARLQRNWVIAAVAVLVLAGLWASSVRARRNPGETALLSLVTGQEAKRTLVVGPDSNVQIYESLTGQRLTPQQYLDRDYLKPERYRESAPDLVPYLGKIYGRSMTETFVPELVEHYLRAIPSASFSAIATSAVSVRNFEEDNAVLVSGPYGNPWVQLFDQNLDFQIVREEKIGYISNRRALSGEQGSYRNFIDDGKSTVCYARLAYVPGLGASTRVLLAGGPHVASTSAAGLFLAESQSLQMMRSALGVTEESELPWFEAIVEARAVGGKSWSTKVVALHRVSGRQERDFTVKTKLFR